MSFAMKLPRLAPRHVGMFVSHRAKSGVAAGFVLIAAAVGSVAFAQAPAPAKAPATAAPAAATSAWDKDAQVFVSGLIGQLSKSAANTSLTPAARSSQLRDILASAMAVERIGGFLLGQNKALATPEQLKEYNQLVPGYIAAQFASRIDMLVEQKLVLGAARQRNASEVIVNTGFTRKRDQTTVAVDWRVVKSSGSAAKIQLLDVYVNGVSPLVTQREEFTSLAKANGFSAILTRLRGHS